MRHITDTPPCLTDLLRDGHVGHADQACERAWIETILRLNTFFILDSSVLHWNTHYPSGPDFETEEETGETFADSQSFLSGHVAYEFLSHIVGIALDGGSLSKACGLE